MTERLSRRGWLLAAPATLGVAAIAAGRPPAARDESAFTYGLNTSTISGAKLPVAEVASIAGRAGYRAIEPWLREVEAHRDSGKPVADLRKQLADLGLAVPSAIGFAEWAVDDAGRRRKGLEQLRRDMDLVRSIGGTRIAAPPVGLTETSGVDLRALGDRYRAACEVGEAIGVVPEAEVWGFSKTLTRLSEAAAIVVESGHPSGCILPDVYHLYKGGSPAGGLRLLRPGTVHVLHMNDYPADPPREAIKDEQRVYPGDGVAPLAAILRGLADDGFQVTLSLELFNRALWARDPAEVAATGLARMKLAVARALA